MAKKPNQKLKLLYLLKFFWENTDEEHSVSVKDIQSYLARYDITADRKIVYEDVEALKTIGIEVIKDKEDNKNVYRINRCMFELAELKLLVDTVQASKFISEKKSRKLIEKLEMLTSKYEAQKLHRQVHIIGRVKTINEKVYYVVDKIHSAINQNRMIKFQYFQWTVDKEQMLRRNGDFYHISPYSLVWEDGNYYMIGYDGQEGMKKHYRVDKMLNVDITDERRQGKEVFDNIDIATYSKKIFGMYNGEEKNVVIEFDNKFAGVVIDRFGKDVSMIKIDENRFRTTVRIALSGQFLGWIISLGEGVKIVSPSEVVEDMRKEGERLCRLYGRE